MEFKFIAILLSILFAVCAITTVKSDDVQIGKRKNNVNILKLNETTYSLKIIKSKVSQFISKIFTKL